MRCELIPFASWDAYDLCIQATSDEVWECARLAAQAEQQTIEWEMRAMLSLREGCYDLYEAAMIRREEFVDEAKTAYDFADDFRAQYDAYRQIIETMRRAAA